MNREGREAGIIKEKGFLAGIGTGVFLLDHGLKLWAERTLSPQNDRVILPYLLELRYSRNQGMAFGFLSGNVAATLILPVAAVFVWFFVLRRFKATAFTSIAGALMLGGFAGNFLDRLFLGYVVDMIFFPFLPWFICNPADVSISLGVGMLALSLLFRPQDWREKHGKENRDSGC